MSTIERLKELEENTSDCYPEVMTFVAEMRRTLPALLAVVEDAKALSERLAASLDGEMDPWLKDILFKMNHTLQGALAALDENSAVK